MKRQGFTLIELLIVVAIIGILAAIAIPNFLQAQVRAKAARAKSELKTIATALELYNTDQNDYPPNTHIQLGDISNGLLRFNITTPIDYLSNKELIDPFVPKYTPIDELYYTYQNIYWYRGLYGSTYAYGGSGVNVFLPDGSTQAELFYGHWRALSYGPDQKYSEYPPNSWGQQTYDPTNGTVSNGNILYGQAPGFIEYIPGE